MVQTHTGKSWPGMLRPPQEGCSSQHLCIASQGLFMGVVGGQQPPWGQVSEFVPSVQYFRAPSDQASGPQRMLHCSSLPIPAKTLRNIPLGSRAGSVSGKSLSTSSHFSCSGFAGGRSWQQPCGTQREHLRMSR